MKRKTKSTGWMSDEKWEYLAKKQRTHTTQKLTENLTKSCLVCKQAKESPGHTMYCRYDKEMKIIRKPSATTCDKFEGRR